MVWGNLDERLEAMIERHAALLATGHDASQHRRSSLPLVSMDPDDVEVCVLHTFR
jgi:hypothetical protein